MRMFITSKYTYYEIIKNILNMFHSFNVTCVESRTPQGRHLESNINVPKIIMFEL